MVLNLRYIQKYTNLYNNCGDTIVLVLKYVDWIPRISLPRFIFPFVIHSVFWKFHFEYFHFIYRSDIQYDYNKNSLRHLRILNFYVLLEFAHI